MLLEMREEVMTALWRDPVFAVDALMGWRMPAFQGASLKMAWYFPYTFNLSGTSSGKTLEMFWHACLSAILMPGQKCGLYFPTWDHVGKTVYWPYYKRTIAQSPRFARELVMYRRKLGETRGGSCWSMNFRNGAVHHMPAPNFMDDAKSQAGQRYNRLYCDEYFVIAGKSKGIEKELIQRVSEPPNHRHHPWRSNHMHFYGHAEAASHPGNKMVREYKEAIRDGSLDYAVYTFCPYDIPGCHRSRQGLEDPAEVERWKPMLFNPKVIRAAKMSGRQVFMETILGLSGMAGDVYYPEATLLRGGRLKLAPEERRRSDAHYILGFDPAPGQGLRSDWAGASILRVRQVPLRELEVPGEINGERANFVRVGKKVWELAYVWAWKGHNLGAMDMAALIQIWHRLFNFSSIVLDPGAGGGGSLIYKELLKDEVEMNGQRWKVTPLCTPWEPASHDKRAIVHFFGRGNGRGGPGSFDFLPHVGPGFLLNPAGFLAAHHLQFRRRWEAREIGFPLHKLFGKTYRGREEVESWTSEQRAVQERIEEGITQLSKVTRLLGKDGAPLLVTGGFNVFGSSVKKDMATAMLQAAAGAELLMAGDGDEEEEGGFA